MKRILLLFAALIMSVGVWADVPKKVQLTFTNLTANGADVIVTDGINVISGVTATYEGSVSDGVTKTLIIGNTAGTEKALCPTYANAQNKGYTMTFKLQGLNGFKFSKANIDAWGLNSGGGNQVSTGRNWNISLYTSSDNSNWSQFGSTVNKDLSASQPPHADFEYTADLTTLGNECYLQITTVKTTSYGCFCGIKSITLEDNSETNYSYTLTINGADGATVRIGENDYTSGQTVESQGKAITADDVIPSNVSGKKANVEVTDGAITVTYVVDPIIANHYIYLLNKQHNVYLGVNDAHTQLSSTSNKTEYNVWQLIADGNNYKLYNPETKVYAGKIVSRNGAIPAVAVDDAGIFTISENGEYYNLKCTNGASTGYQYLHQVDWGGYACVDWNADANASLWTITVADYTPTTKAIVTYHYVLGGSSKDVETQQTVGSTVMAPTAIPFAELVYDTEATVGPDGTTVQVAVTEHLPFVVTTDVNNPVVGILRIHSNQTRYAYINEEGKGVSKNSIPADVDNSFLWYVTGNVLDGFKLYNVAKGGLEATATQASAGEASTWQIQQGANGSQYTGAFAFWNADRTYINGQGDNSGIGNLNYWGANDQGSALMFVQNIEVTIGETGHATFYHQYPVAAQGLKAYTLEENDTYLVANEISAIAPKTGVVLKGEAGQYRLPVAAASHVENNCLSGTLSEKNNNAEEVIYVLSSVQGEVGFYKFGGEKLAANKAYYVPAEGQQVQGFVIDFGGVTTAINAAQQAQSQKASFDLQGRRINKATRGLFIQNGQKVIR